MRDFRELAAGRRAAGKLVCVGLDPELDDAGKKVPPYLRERYGRLGDGEVNYRFAMGIVEATADVAGWYKPNLAFWLRYGGGMEGLQRLVHDVNLAAPGIPLILDAKFGDIGNTNLGYVEYVYDRLGTDAVTAHSYLGCEAMQPFLDRTNVMTIFMAKTSNPGAGEFQDLPVPTPGELRERLGFKEDDEEGKTVPLWLLVAWNVSQKWNVNGNCGIVVGATYPAELAQSRAIVGPKFNILIPGGGKKGQGGSLEKSVLAGGESGIYNFARDVIYAGNGPDFANEAWFEATVLNEQIVANLAAAA